MRPAKTLIRLRTNPNIRFLLKYFVATMHYINWGKLSSDQPVPMRRLVWVLTVQLIRPIYFRYITHSKGHFFRERKVVLMLMRTAKTRSACAPAQSDQCYFAVRSLIGNIIFRKYSDRQACANSADLDQTPQHAASYQGLHCLRVIQHFIRHNNR